MADLISTNDLYNRTYCEPYAGGAGLALQLLGCGFSRAVALNDSDPAVHAVWRSILTQPDELCALVRDAPLNMDYWWQQKAIYEQPRSHSELELGFAAFYLNRTNRSGILQGAGPIGGYNQLGKWKIDARYNRGSLVSSIQKIASFADKIQISGNDALDFLHKRLSDENAFFYLDPPYYVKGHRLYTNFYQHDDHSTVASLLFEHRAARWVVSYDDVEPIRKMYASCKNVAYNLNYSAGRKRNGAEVMFCSDKISFPAQPRTQCAA